MQRCELHPKERLISSADAQGFVKAIVRILLWSMLVNFFRIVQFMVLVSFFYFILYNIWILIFVITLLVHLFFLTNTSSFIVSSNYLAYLNMLFIQN